MQERSLIIRPWSECDPAQAAARLQDRRGLVWLDSALPLGEYGRWSVVAAEPRWTLTARGRRVVRREGTAARAFDADPIATLTSLIEAESAAANQHTSGGCSALPFVGGAIGYLGFELARQIERLPVTTIDDVGAPDLAFGWYDAALVWDRQAAEGWLAGTSEGVEALAGWLRQPSHSPSQVEQPPCPPGVCLASNFTRSEYLAAVAQARRYIEAGDIYQVNLSQRFSTPVTGSGFELYTRLRSISPAPFAAYLALGGIEVLSSSPERLLLMSGGRLQTRPIKGTRRRGMTPVDDARQAAALLASAKDAAEHVMIVDLERNDLGRVSRPGSVHVPQFAALESFAQVHHLTSTVESRRRPEATLEAVWRAVFPGGSITGAPKVRALEIIDELEPTVRGVYTGAIGYVSAHGRSDLNVAIRTITLASGVAHLHVGGAIVHDSEPEAEYLETLDKARGMALALGATLPDEQPAVTVAAP